MLDVKKMQASAKKIAKNEKLFIQRKGNAYFITNSYYMVIVNQGIYKGAFVPAAPEYKELNDGEMASRLEKGKMPELTSPQDFTRIVPAQSLKAIDKTPFSADLSYSAKNKQIAKIYLNDNKIIAINQEYFEIVAPFIQSDEMYQEENKSPETTPIVSGEVQEYASDDFLSAVVLLPIRQELSKQEITIARKGTAEATSDKKAAKSDNTKAVAEAKMIIAEARAEARAEAERITAEIIAKAEAEAENIKEAARKEAETMTRAHEKAHADIVRNEEHNGIELYFQTFPAASIRNELKAAHWKWYPAKKCWYAKATDENIALAERIAG